MENKQKNGKELLKKAFAELDRSYCENFEEEEMEFYSQDIVDTEFSIVPPRRRRAFPKRIAATAAVLLIFFSTATMLVKGEDFTRWVLDFYETNVKIHFQDDDVQKAPATIETIYMPTYIPERYGKTPAFKDWSSTVIFKWMSENGNYIQFLQSNLDGEGGFDTENVEYSEIYHNELLIVCIKKRDVASYHWHTDEYYFNLIIYPHESDEENFKIIDSIQKYENTDNKEILP